MQAVNFKYVLNKDYGVVNMNVNQNNSNNKTMRVMAANITNKNHSRFKKSTIRFIHFKAIKYLCFGMD
jgi:hypothetical protein